MGSTAVLANNTLEVECKRSHRCAAHTMSYNQGYSSFAGLALSPPAMQRLMQLTVRVKKAVLSWLSGIVIHCGPGQELLTSSRTSCTQQNADQGLAWREKNRGGNRSAEVRSAYQAYCSCGVSRYAVELDS
jgi:hypothetical protein